MPATKKIPMRKCTGCGEMKPKKELLRILLEPDGNITIDETGKKNGRGAYICRGLERSFKVAVSPEVYTKLKDEYEWPIGK